jgi:hypothetical protein
MSTPEGCREFATQCRRWADQAKTEDQQRAFLDMARAWTQAAMRMEGVLIPDADATTRHKLDTPPTSMAS